ncbi:MAG: hypothetical protein LBE84_01230, partial [Planctomycetota bacterium]|nr:hypothetical protein [Planctomycetota bacterium]
DVLIAAFSGEKTALRDLSESEKDTLKRVSERISKFIDQTLARNNSKRERVEETLEKWFSRLTMGERQGPFDLINLFHAAAMGTISDKAGE